MPGVYGLGLTFFRVSSNGTMAIPFVPSPFRLTLLNATKRREPIRTEIPAQPHDRRYRDGHQKFELYFSVATDRSAWFYQCGSRLLPWPQGQ